MVRGRRGRVKNGTMSANGTKRTSARACVTSANDPFRTSTTPYGPGADRVRALYLECCTCRRVSSRERQEFAPDQA